MGKRQQIDVVEKLLSVIVDLEFDLAQVAIAAQYGDYLSDRLEKFVIGIDASEEIVGKIFELAQTGSATTCVLERCEQVFGLHNFSFCHKSQVAKHFESTVEMDHSVPHRPWLYEKWSTGTSGPSTRVLHSPKFFFENLFLAGSKSAALNCIEIDLSRQLHLLRIVDRPDEPSEIHIDPNGIAGPVLWLSADTSSSEGLCQVIEIMESFNPAIISSKPSVFEPLMSLIHKRSGVRCDVQLVISGGANLTEELRKLLECTFQAPVRGMYSLSETGTIAVECSSGCYHVDVSAYVVELLTATPAIDAQKQLVVSSTLNGCLPLARFLTFDHVDDLYENCSCGRSGPFFKRIEGRVNPSFYWPDSTPYSPEQLFRRARDFCPHLVDYQVAQISLQKLDVTVELKDTSPPLLAEKVERFFRDSVSERQNLTFRIAKFPRTRKFQRYRQCVVLRDSFN